MTTILNPYQLRDIRHNLYEIATELLLLEQHLYRADRRCIECITKHCMTIEGYAKEALSLDGTDNQRALAMRAIELCRIALPPAQQQATLRNDELARQAASRVRQVRKFLSAGHINNNWSM